MKTKSLTHIMTGLAAVLITPSAFAIEAPADDAPPPPAAEKAPEADAAPAKAEAKEEIAYLGVLSSEVPDMLAQHLGLKPGEGVIVAALVPDGPAAKAGLAENDIITKVGDKAIGSALELSEQVKSHKPGDALHLDVIQKGKPAGLDVTLGSRPDDLAQMNLKPLDQLKLDGVPKDLADRIRGVIEGNGEGIKLDIQEGAVEIAPQVDQAMREMRERMKKAMQGLDAQVIPGAKIDGEAHHSATFRMNDGQGEIEFKSGDGGKEATVRDNDGKIIWSGPWDTEQDKAAAPKDVRARLDRSNLDTTFQGKGLRFNFNGGDQADKAEEEK